MPPQNQSNCVQTLGIYKKGTKSYKNNYMNYSVLKSPYLDSFLVILFLVVSHGFVAKSSRLHHLLIFCQI